MYIVPVNGFSAFFERLPQSVQAAMLWAGLNNRDKAVPLHKAPREAQSAETQSQRVAQQFYKFLMAMPKVSRRLFLQVMGNVTAALMGAGGPKLIDPVPQIPSGVDLKFLNHRLGDTVARLFGDIQGGEESYGACLGKWGLDHETQPQEIYRRILEMVRTREPNASVARLQRFLATRKIAELNSRDVDDFCLFRRLAALDPKLCEFISRESGLRGLSLDPLSLEAFMSTVTPKAADVPRQETDSPQDADRQSSGFAAGVWGGEPSDEYGRELTSHIPGYPDEHPYTPEPPEYGG